MRASGFAENSVRKTPGSSMPAGRTDWGSGGETMAAVIQAEATDGTRMYPAPRTDLMIWSACASVSSFLRSRPT